MCILSPQSERQSQVRSKMVDLLNQFIKKIKERITNQISLALQAMAVLADIFFLTLLIHIIMYYSVIFCI